MRSLNHMKNTAARNCWAMQTMLFQFGHPIALVLGLMYFLCWTITKKSHFHGKSLIFFFFLLWWIACFLNAEMSCFLFIFFWLLSMPEFISSIFVNTESSLLFLFWLPSMVPRVRYQQWKRLKIANKMKVKDKKYALQM